MTTIFSQDVVDDAKKEQEQKEQVKPNEQKKEKEQKQKETEQKALELDTIVVTGTKTSRALSDVPVRTEVVTKEMIEKNHAKTLKDALENMPGLYFSKSHGKSGAVVSMQGFDENRILILIDGKRIIATTGASVDLSQIPITNVERIEVVKGAVSALHGSDAMGGVINVITKKSEDRINFSFGADAGSYLNYSRGNHIDTEHVYQTFSIQNKKTQFYVNADYTNDKGFDFDDSNIDSDGDKIKHINVLSGLNFTLTPQLEMGVDFKYFSEDKWRVFSTFVPGIGSIKNYYTEELSRYQYSANFKYLFDSGSLLKLNLSYEDFFDQTIEDVATSKQKDRGRNADVDLLNSDLQYDHMISDTLLLTFGFSSLREVMSQDQFINGSTTTTDAVEIKPGSTRTNIALYSQVDWHITEKIEFLPGVRYQYDSDFGNFVAPKANIAFKIKEDMLLRAGYGVGYRVPNLKERYYFFDHSSLGYQVMGNPDLQPEKSHSFQLGFDFKVQQSLHFEWSLFYNKIRNLIDTQVDDSASRNAGLEVYNYQNIGRAKTFGGEFNVSKEFSKYLRLSAGYVYLEAKDEELNKDLPNRSKHQIKAGMILTKRDWGSELLLDWVYQSKEYVDVENTQTSAGWNTFDVKYNQKIGKNLNLFAGVKNVFDVHRMANPSASTDLRPASGRYFYLGFKYDFNIKKEKEKQ